MMMIEKEVLLHIKGVQQPYAGDKQEMELTTRGLYSRKEGVWHVSYDESELSGLEGATTEIQVNGNEVIMRRQGDYGARMEFCLGRRFQGQYLTPFGALELAIMPSVVRAELNSHGGEVHLKYQMSIAGETSGINELTVRVREAL